VNSPEAILAYNSARLFSSRSSSTLFNPFSTGSGREPFEEKQVVRLPFDIPGHPQNEDNNPQCKSKIKLKRSEKIES